MKVYGWSRERYSGTPRSRTARTTANVCNVNDHILSQKRATRTLQTMRLQHLRLGTATCIPEPVNDNAFFEAASDCSLHGLEQSVDYMAIAD